MSVYPNGWAAISPSPPFFAAPDSPAAQSVLRAGDVVVRVAYQPVDSSDQLGSVVRLSRPGDTVSVTVDRDGTELSLEAKLSEGPTS